ncbi:hypothetical protein DFH07DRAFT_1032649 [Mycena maculata]|uniref:N-acetyltransferase domain-containing protein n=1 Tax=Mycena maculata TaxID=230809 RepID=A0AAD7IVG7_9AGAR|nr:hypothetical protein DFH07DRAFT_1032649 [Mycena maculata]
MTLSEVTHTDKIVVLQHDSAEDFLAVAYPTLRRHERSANIVLAHALTRAPAVEYVLTDCQFLTDADVELPSSAPPRQGTCFWLTVWSHSKSEPVLDMALSCLDSSFGNYPIFLWTAVEQSVSSSHWLDRRMDVLAQHLRACLNPERVFSVFGTAVLAETFAKVWTGLAGFQIAPEPLYTAFFVVCTPQTLKPSKPAKGLARKATMLDVAAAGRLCQEFAATSHYRLGEADAMLEAQALIEKGQLWVVEKEKEIASICAVTRTSLRVSAITKVFTTPKWRRHGFAQDVVYEVTHRLFECGKHSVVLYVDPGNSAKRVYERVGFTEGGEVWLELGFQVGKHTGHW